MCVNLRAGVLACHREHTTAATRAAQARTTARVRQFLVGDMHDNRNNLKAGVWTPYTVCTNRQGHCHHDATGSAAPASSARGSGGSGGSGCQCVTDTTDTTYTTDTTDTTATDTTARGGRTADCHCHCHHVQVHDGATTGSAPSRSWAAFTAHCDVDFEGQRFGARGRLGGLPESAFH